MAQGVDFEFLREVFSTFMPATKACWTHQFRHLGVGQQYPVGFGDFCIQNIIFAVGVDLEEKPSGERVQIWASLVAGLPLS
jgi:hypothetical protein